MKGVQSHALIKSTKQQVYYWGALNCSYGWRLISVPVGSLAKVNQTLIIETGGPAGFTFKNDALCEIGGINAVAFTVTA